MNVIPKLTNYKFSQIKLIRQRYVQANDVVRHILPPLSFTKLKLFLQNELPVKFLIVRHPFDRLLSAYRDKFEVFKATKHYYQMVSRKKLKVKTKLFLNNVHQILFKENIALSLIFIRVLTSIFTKNMANKWYLFIGLKAL